MKNGKQMKVLPVDDECVYDRSQWKNRPIQSRLDWLESQFIPHDDLTRLVTWVERELMVCQARQKGSGVLVIAPSGAGKTTAIKHLKSLYPDDITDTLTVRSFVFFKIPKSPTPKALGTALLQALGDPCAEVGGAQQKFERARLLLLSCKTRVIAIDDFQDVPARRKAPGVREIGDWMRDLCEIEFPGVVLAFGTEEAAVVRDVNLQLRRRMQARIEFKAFSTKTTPEANKFKSLIKAIDDVLPLAEVSDLGDTGTLARIGLATGGNFDYIMKLLAKALMRAVAANRERILMEDLKAAFEDQHQVAAFHGNPFSSDFNGDHLTQPGQIFHCQSANDEKLNSSSSQVKKRA